MSPSRRFEDWAARLDAYLAANRDRPFSYDSALGLDCCVFTFGAIESMTGIAIGKQFAGKYTTRKGSLLAMMDYCGRPSLLTFIGKLMDEYGFEHIRHGFAGRGDVAICFQVTGHDFLGIVDLNGRDVLGIGDGIRRVPISRMCMAWRIG